MHEPNKKLNNFFNELINEALKHKSKIFFVLACMAFAKAAAFGIPYLLKIIIDKNTSISNENKYLIPVAGIVLSYTILNVLSVLFNELKEYLSTKVTQNIVAEIGTSIFGHLLSLRMKFHTEIKTGALSRDIDRGLKGLQSVIGVLIYSVIPSAIELTLVIGYFYFCYDIKFAATLLATLIAYISYSFYATNIWATSRHEINQADSNANQKLLEVLTNIEIVKAFSNEKHELKEYRKNLNAFASASTNAQSVHSKLAISQQIIISTGLGISLWLATEGVANGSMTVGDIVLINALLLQIYMPLSFLGIIYKDMKQCAIDIERLAKIVDESNSGIIKNKKFENIEKNLLNSVSIKFENVEFGYSENRLILKGISFEIPQGTTTAIVGPTGSGKSTIAKLLLKIYELNRGRIFINDLDMSDVSEETIRHLSGIIPQDIALFNDTIYNNIKYGKLEATADEVMESAKKAQIHEFITSLEKGYETLVGERGIKLSGGERQRLAIARALIRDPKFLVFDEATSALDTKTELAFQSEIIKNLKNKTSLIIAHRLSTIINSDQIIVLDQGRIIESGNHQELLRLNGLYSRMWASQIN